MKFTVIFEHQGSNMTYTLDFIPCPCWMNGEDLLINLNPKSPYYSDVKEGCKALMQSEGLSLPLRATVVVFSAGNGGDADLQALVKDMTSCGIELEILRSGFKEYPS